MAIEARIVHMIIQSSVWKICLILTVPFNITCLVTVCLVSHQLERYFRRVILHELSVGTPSPHDPAHGNPTFLFFLESIYVRLGVLYDGLNVHARVQKAEGAGAVRTTRARSESGRWSEAKADRDC